MSSYPIPNPFLYQKLTQRHQKPGAKYRPSPCKSTIRSAHIIPKASSLVPERHILYDSRVVTVAAHDVNTPKVVCMDEEHVLFLINALEAGCVVRKQVSAVSGSCIPEEYALDLARIVSHKLWVILHYVRVRSVSYEHKLPLRKRLEHFIEEGFTDR